MAIAYDNSATGSGLSFSYTCTGSNLLLLVFLQGAQGGSDLVTSCSYNGVSMTKFASILANSSSRWLDAFYLLNPATGSNTVVCDVNSVDSFAISYTGVSQSSFPDSQNTGTGNSTSITLSSSVVNSGCWLTMGLSLGVTSSWSSGTSLQRGHTSDFDIQVYDSNGTVGTGSQSLNASGSALSYGNSGGIIVSFAPATSSGKSSLSLLRTG